MAEGLTIGAVVTLALGSSVIGSLVTQIATSFREGRSAKRETAYLALRIATVLERFAEDATDFIEQVNSYKSNPGQGVSTKLPQLRPFPDEKERWRDLEVKLSARILGFDEYRRSRQGSIDDTWEHAGPEEGIDTARGYGILLAMSALKLGGDVRKRYGLPEFDTASVWPDFLSSEFDDLPDHWKAEART